MPKETYPIKQIAIPDLPAKLREINDPPKKFFYRGTPLSDFYQSDTPYKFLTVIGSRKYSDYAKAALDELIQGLAGYPIVIISGLAIGIDSLAHQDALRHGLSTISVPGSGLDDSVLYPVMNRKVAQNILEAGGTLVSEYEPTFKATLWSFPKRNRILAGLSDATLVISATLGRPGTLITARLAMEYNRDVLALEHSIFEPGGAGPHDLKFAPGGLFDLDFLAQAIVLAAGQTDWIGRDGGTVLRRAGEGGLIPQDLAAPLAEAYETLDAVSHWQRLTLDDPAKPPSPNAARQIARAMGLPDARTLAAELRQLRRMTRSSLVAIRAAVMPRSGRPHE